MTRYDICIIGGGVIGTSIAHELSKYRLKVVVLEKEVELAFGVSKSNSGIIHPGTQNSPGSLKGRLCVRGNFLTRRLAGELGVELKEVGELIVAFNSDEESRLSGLLDDGRALGVPGLKIVDSRWLRKREPNLSREAKSALYSPTASVISPYRWVYALAENSVVNGVEVFTETEVVGVGKHGDGFSVSTNSGVVEAKYIVNAAGLYADRISAMVGVTDFIIKPRKGEEFLLDKKRENITNHLIFPLPSKASKGVLIIKTSDGNPMIGPTSDEVEDRTDLSTTASGLERVLANARKLVPSINDSDIIAYFAGLRPTAGDDFIIRGEKDLPGFINVAGIQSPGLTAAPAIAEMVAGILKAQGLALTKKAGFKARRKKDFHLFSDTALKAAEKMIANDPDYGDIVCRCELVSRKEIDRAIDDGAKTLDGIKFRTRAQAGRCHGSFCTTRILNIMAERTGRPVTDITKRGPGSEIVKVERKP